MMQTNLHTHSTFCDGKNTPEEIVRHAIASGFSSIGFSGHGYTAFDLRYCMKDTAAYIAEISRLKDCCRREIQVYLGVEEDAFQPVTKKNFDYIIGSSHYYCVDGRYYPIDSNPECFQTCLALFGSDPVRMAEAYYEPFCRYILRRKPDIVGHFDLITKFDELAQPLFLENAAYHRTARTYLRAAAQSGCLFEVNTGAIARGYRTSPYPHETLLQELRKSGNGLVLSSDSHCAETLSFGFCETRSYLKDQGFSFVYALYNGEFVRDYL